MYLFQSTSSRYFAQSSTLNSSRNSVNRTVSWHAVEPIQLTCEPRIIPKWGDVTVDNIVQELFAVRLCRGICSWLYDACQYLVQCVGTEQCR